MYLIKITLLAAYNCGREAILYATDSIHGAYGLSDGSAKVFFDRSWALKIAKRIKDSYQLDYVEDGSDTHSAKVELIHLTGANPEEV